MNELVEKKTILIKAQSFLKTNYKYLITILILFIILFVSIQFYYIYNKNSILKISIDFNDLKSNQNNIEIEKKLSKLSNNNNFFGILSTLEGIKIKLKNDNIDSAYNDYLKLLNNKKLDSIYISSIAINASYNFLGKIKLNNKTIANDNKILSDLIFKIKNLITYIDDSIDSYNNYKLEILYLIAVINQDNKVVNSLEEMNSLYQQIIENDNFSSSIKERVKKINDLQKYK